MDLKSIGIKSVKIDNYNNNYLIVTICNDNLFNKCYENLFGLKPFPLHQSQNGIYPTGNSMSYKLPKTKLNKMIVNIRKEKLNTLN